MAIEKFQGGTIITGQGIELFQRMATVKAMQLELRTGLKHSKLGSVISKYKKAHGLKGNKAAIVAQAEKDLDAYKAQYAANPANGMVHQ